jgi:recombination protein RecA
MPVDPAQLDASIKAIKARYEKKAGGHGRSIQFGDEEPPVDRYSFGSLAMDYATGGGVPIGRWTRIYGGYSSGKSMTCWNIIKSAQSKGHTCAYYNVEKQYTKEFAESMGVDVDKLIVVQGTAIEDIGVKMQELFKSVHLHVVDSCSQAVSIDEMAMAMHEWRPGISARAWGKTLRKTGEYFDDNENTVVLVDQIRDSFNGAAGPPGGRFLEHVSSLSLHFRKGSWLFRRQDGTLDLEGVNKESPISEMVEPAGTVLQMRVDKSRVCRPLKTATIRLDFGEWDKDGNVIFQPGLDEMYEVIKFAKLTGIVEKTSEKSSYYRRGDGEPFVDGATTKQGEASLMTAFREDQKLVEQTKNAARKLK